MRRILITYGSKRGGTAELATTIAETLRGRGFAVDCEPVSAVRSVEPYDAVIVGGALYMMRWVREARRFVARNARALRARPVWMFSSGPLDDSAAKGEISPVASVAALMKRVGARGHATFGGRLTKDAKGFIARSMAKTRAGDWRNGAQVQTWARGVADELATLPEVIHTPAARPAQWPLAVMSLVIGLFAIVAGLPLLVSGRASFSILLMAGLLLLIVIGGVNAIAGVARRRARAHAMHRA